MIGAAVTITNMIVACEDALKRKSDQLASLPSMIRELKNVGSKYVTEKLRIFFMFTITVPLN